MVVGVVVAVSLAGLSWDGILEEWYIHRLSSDDEAVQLHAAEKLVALDSARSISTPRGAVKGCVMTPTRPLW